MTTYTVMPHRDDGGFDVAIVGSDGTRQTILGFATEAEAQAWIARDRWLSEQSLSGAAASVRYDLNDVPIIGAATAHPDDPPSSAT